MVLPSGSGCPNKRPRVDMRELRIIVVLLTAVVLCSSCENNRQAERQDVDAIASADTLGLLVDRIRQCSRLYTTEYRIHKIVTHEDVVRLKGKLMNRHVDMELPFGERKMAIPMDATVKAWIDLQDVTEENIEREDGRIRVLLPTPQLTLTSTKIRQNEVKEFVGLMRSRFTDKELTSYQQQGRQAIIESLDRERFVSEAQANAARVLVPLIVQMGYREEDISIVFRKDFDLETLLNHSVEKR